MTLSQATYSFQAELGMKRFLRLPKSTANNIVRLALNWPSGKARVLCINFCFLYKTVSLVTSDCLSSQVFCSLATEDVEALQLVRQCRTLEASLEFAQ